MKTEEEEPHADLMLNALLYLARSTALSAVTCTSVVIQTAALHCLIITRQQRPVSATCSQDIAKASYCHRLILSRSSTLLLCHQHRCLHLLET